MASTRLRAFVTGGGGYVGSALCKQLLERGYTVAAFDIHYQQNEEESDDGIQRIKVICFLSAIYIRRSGWREGA